MNRRKSVFFKTMFCFLLLFITGRQFTQAQAPTFTVMTSPVLDPNINCYWRYLPRDYATDVSTTYPLIVFFHGVGECGVGSTATIQNKTWVWGPGKLMQAGTFPESFVVGGNTFRFIAFCPQIKLGLDYSASPYLVDSIRPNLVDAVIEYAKANYRVDLTRIYLCGLSMGGGATLHYAGNSAAYANKLAAIVAACPARTASVVEANTIAAAKLPVLITQNADDPTVNATGTATTVTRLNAYAPAPPRVPRKVQWATGGHNVWSRTYENIAMGSGNLIDTMSMNIYSWMLQFTRVGGNITVLPLTWKDFTAQGVNGNVALQWTISQALNIASFTVERSDDGTNWSVLKTFPAQKGNEQVYNYTDESVTGSTVFYRIKQTDVDGAYSYSAIKKVTVNKRQEVVRIFPNPFNQQININLSHVNGNNITIKLVNAGGRTVIKQQHVLSGPENVVTIDNLRHLTRGLYYVVVENEDGEKIYHSQVLKQ